MKKFLKVVGAVALATLAFFIVSCKYNITNDNSGIVTLGAPDVKGKTYPGVNYVYWDKVANDSKGYDYYVYEDGVLQNSSPIHTYNNCIVDTDLQNNVEKQYKVRATGDRTTRTVFFQEGEFGSISLTSILPPYSATPTELAEYELSEEKQQYRFSPSTITVTSDDKNTGKFTVSFPAKPYLSYTIYADKGNKSSIFDEHEITVATYQNFTNNKFATVSGQITKAGEYTISVKASSVNPNYVNSEEIVSYTTLRYDDYEISGTDTAKNVESKYTSKTNVQVTWNPIKDAMGTTLSPYNYQIYRSNFGSTTYERVNSIIEEILLPGSSESTYYFNDTVSGTSSYVYTFVVTNGTKISKYATTHSISAYTTISTTGTASVSTRYTNKNVVRVSWNPAIVENGKEISDYRVYRKISSDSDDSYTELFKNIISSYDANGNKVYYIEDSITDNTISYTYAVTYKYESTIYKNTNTISAYTTIVEALTVEFFANDSDCIANDAKVSLTIDDDKTITSVKYLILDSDDSTSYYASDYTKELAIEDATITEQTYEWIISDVTADSYVAVVAIVDNKAVYKVSSTVSGTEPAEEASTSDFTVSLSLYDADNDNIKNDAKIVIIRPSLDATISAKYGTGWSEEEAKEAAVSETGTEITIDGDYAIYYIIEKDVISNENIVSDEWKYVSVALTISEPGKKDSVIYSTEVFSRDYVDEALSSINGNSLKWKDSDGDGIYNDIYFNIAKDGEDSADISKLSLTVTYATADDLDTAKNYLNTSNAKTLAIVTGKNFYEFNSTDYPVLKDIGGTDEQGVYFAMRITASDTNRKDVSLDYVTSLASYNENATVTDISEIGLSTSLISLSDDSQKNDIYATFSTSLTQTIESISYATADENNYTLLKNRVSDYSTEIGVSNVKELYRTDSRIYYEVYRETNLAVGTYVALKVQLAEEGLDSASKINIFGPVTETTVTLSTTEAPTLSKYHLYFTANDRDSNYNDISDAITISIDVDQTIKSITGAKASSLDIAKKIASGEEVYPYDYPYTDQPVHFGVPTEYTLETSVINNKAKLSKKYKFSPYFENVEDGNYVAIAIVISQTGYEDNTVYITSRENYIEYTTYLGNHHYFTSANASQRAVTSPSYQVSNFDSNNNENELVHITIYDEFYNDDIGNYTYKLERTTEKSYNDSDTIWETVEDSIVLDHPDETYYYKDLYYKHDSTSNYPEKNIDANTTYVYRLTKTRNEWASVTGEEEAVIQDAKVTPKYYIPVPTINFSSYKSGAPLLISATETYDSNFDYFEKYTYSVQYRIHYNNLVYTDWITIPDSKVVWTHGTNLNEKPTSTMLATIDDEISSNYYGDTYSYATLEVQLVKAIVDDTSYSNTSDTSLNITWNPIAEIKSNVGVTLTLTSDENNNYSFRLNNNTGKKISSYTWYVDGEIRDDSNTEQYTLTKSGLSKGSHEVLVVAQTKSGLTYSASKTIVY